ERRSAPRSRAGGWSSRPRPPIFGPRPDAVQGRATHLPAGPDPTTGATGRMTRVRRLGLALALLLVLLAPCATAATRRPLTVRLANALAVPGAPARSSGAVALDLLSGRTLFARNPDLPLVPASNEKLLVTYGALEALGPTYRFRTEVLGSGHLSGGVWHGNIVLKGFGDPTLTSAGLKRLVAQLKRQGIERVTGRVV